MKQKDDWVGIGLAMLVAATTMVATPVMAQPSNLQSRLPPCYLRLWSGGYGVHYALVPCVVGQPTRY